MRIFNKTRGGCRYPRVKCLCRSCKNIESCDQCTLCKEQKPFKHYFGNVSECARYIKNTRESQT